MPQRTLYGTAAAVQSFLQICLIVPSYKCSCASCCAELRYWQRFCLVCPVRVQQRAVAEILVCSRRRLGIGPATCNCACSATTPVTCVYSLASVGTSYITTGDSSVSTLAEAPLPPTLVFSLWHARRACVADQRSQSKECPQRRLS